MTFYGGTNPHDALMHKIASAANYPGIVTELLGYLSSAVDSGRQLDPLEMHNYVRDLKRRYVTEPVIAAIQAAATPGPKCVTCADSGIATDGAGRPIGCPAGCPEVTR